jgi:hypothetical protein
MRAAVVCAAAWLVAFQCDSFKLQDHSKYEMADPALLDYELYDTSPLHVNLPDHVPLSHGVHDPSVTRDALMKSGGKFDYLFSRAARARTARSAGRPLVPVCPQRTEWRRPFHARGRDGSVSQLMQLTGYLQEIEVTICSHVGEGDGKCGDVAIFFAENDSVCVQKYTNYRFLSLNVSGGVKTELFMFPSSCTCLWDPISLGFL